MTEDGPREEELAGYGLRPRPGGYRGRTVANIESSDATLIVAGRLNSPGTALTRTTAENLRRPLLVVEPGAPEVPDAIYRWLGALRTNLGHPLTLNVAGNRESVCPGIELVTAAYLVVALWCPGVSPDLEE